MGNLGFFPHFDLVKTLDERNEEERQVVRDQCQVSGKCLARKAKQQSARDNPGYADKPFPFGGLLCLSR